MQPWLALDLPRSIAALVVLAIIVLPGGIPLGAMAFGLLTAKRHAERLGSFDDTAL